MPYPFFMGYSSSILKENKFDVFTIDGAAELLSEKKFLDKVVDFKPDLIVLEVSTVSIQKDLDDAEYFKKNTNAKIVFCGLHNFMYNSEFLKKNKNVDFVLIAEYEYTLLELCKRLKHNKSLKDLKGIIYRSNDGIIDNKRASLIDDLNELPLPDRKSLPMKNYWDVPGNMLTPSVQLISSRGCPFGCIFCAWPQIIYGGHKYRQRKVEEVIKEIKILINEYKVKSIYFDDDTFNVDKKFVENFSKELIKENIKIEWAAMCRADIMDVETLLLKKKSAGPLSRK